MNENKWHLLQLFAEGGEGSATGAESAAVSNTGVSDAAAGHQRLRELGVPENKIRKNRVYNLPKTENAPVEAEPVAEQEQVEEQAAAATIKQPNTEEKAEKRPWKEVKKEYEEEYNQETQAMMRERVRKSKEAEEAMEELAPALMSLAKVYNVDKTDYAAIAKNVMGDNRLYDEKALENGRETNVQRAADQFEIMAELYEDKRNKERNDRAMQEHYTNLVQQGETLKKTFPGFNLQAELKNPVFVRMTAPGTGLMSVEDAYRAVHRKEIEQAALKAAADQTAKNMANAVRSGTMRPQENGSSTTAPSVSTFDYRTASKEQREALKQRIRMAGARGEKIYPGQ